MKERRRSAILKSYRRGRAARGTDTRLCRGGCTVPREYGDIDEPFYSSLETTYAAALRLMKKDELLQHFAIRAREIVDRTRHFGWGFHDTLSQSYSEYYEDKI